MEKILIFISEKKQISKFDKITNQKEFRDKDITTILNFSIDTKDVSPREGIRYKSFGNYESEEQNATLCMEEAKTLIKNCSNLEVDDNSSFSELSSYKGISFWEIYDTTILLYYLTDLIYSVEIIAKIIETEKPRQVVIFGSKLDMACNVLINIAAQKNIATKIYNIRKRITLRLLGAQAAFTKRHFFGIFEIVLHIPFGFYNLGLFLKNFINMIWGKIYNFKAISKNGYAKKILFFVTIKKQLDSVVPLVKELEKEAKNCTLLVDWYWRAGNATPILRHEKLIHKVFDGYATFGINKAIWQINKVFMQHWRLIENSQKFKGALCCDEIFLWDLIKPYLKELFLRHFCKAAGMYEIAQRLFDIEQPRIIVVTNKLEFNARICVIAGKRKNIPSIAITREIFADLPDRDPPIYVDKETVDGRYGYDILVKRGIPADKLIISANPRWDEVFSKKNYSQKDKVFNKLNINPEKKLIVLTTTFLNLFMKQDEYEKLIRNTCEFFKNLPQYHLVIKIHPGDTNEKLAYELCKKIGIKNVTVIRDINIFDLISSSILLITSYSTVGLEAIAMDKPVIVVNLSKTRPEIVPFVSSGAAKGVNKEEDIAGAIKEVLENKDAQEKLKTAREKFISEHIQNFDGQAIKKIAKIITDMN